MMDHRSDDWSVYAICIRTCQQQRYVKCEKLRQRAGWYDLVVSGRLQPAAERRI